MKKDLKTLRIQLKKSPGRFETYDEFIGILEKWIDNATTLYRLVKKQGKKHDHSFFCQIKKAKKVANCGKRFKKVRVYRSNLKTLKQSELCL